MVDIALSFPATFPHPRTQLIGRKAELANARAWLIDEAAPLLTLTGPGGVGKTRLALDIAQQVQAQFADGLFWVDLAQLRDPSLLFSTLAATLALPPAAGSPLKEQLAAYLRSRQALLILDNCEHVLDEASDLVGYLLSSSPAIQVLATSRARLHVRGEQVLPVEPLPVPRRATLSWEDCAHNEAVRLFGERAHAVRPSFTLIENNVETVAALCRQLDGLPLAIELAAARITMLSPEDLLTHIRQRLHLLDRGARDLPPRQQTMTSTIAWSYDLLTPEAQGLLRRLAVFVGGFTWESARVVASSEASGSLDIEMSLAMLVDQSLVRWTENDAHARFTILETIREYAWDKLTACAETSRVRNIHAAYFLGLAEEAMPYLSSTADPAWLDRLEAEHDNVLAALTWLADSGDVSGTVRLAGALGWFWYYHGHFQEGRDWLERALAMDTDDAAGSAPVSARANVLVGLGLLLQTLGEGMQAVGLLAAGAASRRAEGDDLGAAYAESLRGGALISLGQYEEAEPVFAAVLPFYEGHVMAGHALFHLGLVAYTRDDRERTRILCEEAVKLFDATGARLDAIEPLHYLGLNACAMNDAPAAAAYFAEALRLLRIRRSRVDFANGLADVATLAMARGDLMRVARFSGVADAIRREDGAPFPLPARIAYERAAMKARGQLGDTTWSSAYAAGEALSLDQALLEAEAFVTLNTERPLGEAPALPDVQSEPVPGDTSAAMLTRRERDVLKLLCQRLTDPEIAARLFISSYTASKHVSNVLGKLGVANRREAAALAARHSLV